MKLRQTIWKTGIVLFGAFCLCLSVLERDASAAHVNVGLTIALPPAYRIAAPPPMIVIPGTYVYVVPDIDVDILFFRGAWYRPHEGHWFSAFSYNGPWRLVAPSRVPRELVELPRHDYRRIPPGHNRIPYGQLKRSWRGWERNRYWEGNAAWRGGWQKHNEQDHQWQGGPGKPEGRDRDHDLRDGRLRDVEPRRPAGPERGHENPDRPHGR